MLMSQPIREEMLPRLGQRYRSWFKSGRSKMLDKFCEQFRHDRKHTIKLLGGKAGWGGDYISRCFWYIVCKLRL